MAAAATKVDTAQPAYLTVDQLAARWGVSRSRIYEFLPLGLPSIKIGRLRRFHPGQADTWLEATYGDTSAA